MNNLKHYALFGASILLVGSLFTSLPAAASYDGTYNYSSDIDLWAPDWMKNVGNERTLSQLSIIYSHDTMTYNLNRNDDGDSAITQRASLETQLNSGIRGIDIRVKWDMLYQKFDLYHGSNNLDLDFELDALETVRMFLAFNPTETVVMHLQHEWAEEVQDSTFARKMWDIFDHSDYDGLFWDSSTTTNPKMSDMRGKIVLIRNFWPDDYDFPGLTWDDMTMPSFTIDGIADRTSVTYNYADSLHGMYFKSELTEKSLDAANNGDPNDIYVTGLNMATVGSRPFFSASGHTSPWNTSGHQEYDAILETDWPRYEKTNCVTITWWRWCDIELPGQNEWAYDHIEDNKISRYGILSVDFPGPLLIEQSIELSLGAYVSNWVDRDNPGGSGDFEKVSDMYNAGQISCRYPLRIEARRKSDKKDSSKTGEVINSLNTGYGFSCLNSQQSDGSCADYEVRVWCNFYSSWLDRDNPGGSGDYEDIANLYSSGQLSCTDPYYIDVRRKSDKVNALATGQTFAHYSTSYGFACKNVHQSGN